MSIQPFRFHLAKLSRADQQVIDGLHQFLPATQTEQSLGRAITDVFDRLIGEKARWTLEQLETVSGKDFYSRLPDPCIVAALSLPPVSHKAFLRIDLQLAIRLIDKLLGGEGETPSEIRPLTDTEQGVLEYFLLQVIAAVHTAFGKKQRCYFRLEQTVMHPQNLERMVETGAKLCLLTYRMTVLGESAVVQLALPHPFVVDGLLKDLPGDIVSGTQESLRKQLRHFAGFKTDLWGEVGSAEVSMKDLSHLESGDVVLFDQTGLNVSSGHWSGDVILKVGDGEHGGFVGRWDGFHKKGTVEIVGKE